MLYDPWLADWEAEAEPEELATGADHCWGAGDEWDELDDEDASCEAEGTETGWTEKSEAEALLDEIP